MKKKFITLSISFFLACFVSGLIEKFMYPNEIFNIKQGIIEICTFFLVFIIFIVSIKDKNNISISNFIKVFFSIGITLYVSISNKNVYYLIFGLLEIFTILLITNIIKSKKISNIISGILFLLYNFQVALLILGGSFLRRIMLSNLESLEDLSGKTVLYVSSAILVIVISFLPAKKIRLNKKNNFAFISSLIVLELIVISIMSLSFSPIGNYVVLANEEIEYQKNLKVIKANAEAAENLKESFHKEEVKDYYKANHGLGEKPNIILIFTEGLSQNVISDEKNIMPNVKEYQEKSINFTGYYNHTFATYRGIIGQLYSGFQYNNFDENHLISIQSILENNGYFTSFVNSEPLNKEFTRYLNSFNFNEVITSEEIHGEALSVSDKDTYNLLLNRSKELNEQNKPFFISTYTFGTHVSLDSPDEKYKKRYR